MSVRRAPCVKAHGPRAVLELNDPETKLRLAISNSKRDVFKHNVLKSISLKKYIYFYLFILVIV